MSPEEARERFATARCARLATADANGKPHIVPLVFALEGDTIYSAVDPKPKRTQDLKRLRNVTANPQVSLLADYYVDDDWDVLWWARADGTGTVHESLPRAAELLSERYLQYAFAPPDGPVLEIAVLRWSGWAA
jgi:PPOX class probable F420-dependent enzyme